eukprot:460965-Hanusia_phi.AAC.1
MEMSTIWTMGGEEMIYSMELVLTTSRDVGFSGSIPLSTYTFMMLSMRSEGSPVAACALAV